MGEREKIIERVRRLLRMAQDASSPNEAAIAAGRARKLMDKYQIDAMEASKTLEVQDDFAEQSGDTKAYRRYPAWMQWLGASVAKLNDCIASFQFADDLKKQIQFKGYSSDVIIAAAMHDYLVKSVERLCEAYSAQYKQTSRTTYIYKTHAANRLCARLRALHNERKGSLPKDSAGTSLVVLKMQCVEAHFGIQKYKKDRARNDEPLTHDEVMAAVLADRDARQISLAPQVSESKNSQESISCSNTR